MKRRAFTLVELMVVVIIIAILAVIALPQFFRASEKARASEGVNILGAIRSAQFRYYAEDDSQQYADTLTKLDMDFGTLKYFADPVMTGSSHNQNGCGVLGAVTRKGGDALNYTLTIHENGTITCKDNGCPPGFVTACQ